VPTNPRRPTATQFDPVCTHFQPLRPLGDCALKDPTQGATLGRWAQTGGMGNHLPAPQLPYPFCTHLHPDAGPETHRRLWVHVGADLGAYPGSGG